MDLHYTLTPGATPPTRSHEYDAGLDLAAAHDAIIPAGMHVMVSTGVHAAIPRGHVGLLFVRSSLGAKRQLSLSNGVGVIDAGYIGEIKCSLHNTGLGPQQVLEGERIVQLVVVPIALPSPRPVESLDDTARGDGGFGSTG